MLPQVRSKLGLCFDTQKENTYMYKINIKPKYSLTNKDGILLSINVDGLNCTIPPPNASNI